MTKLIATLPALALVVALSNSAVADNGISQNTLQDMGLAGIEVMSDSEALAIRGMGYTGPKLPKMPKPKDGHKKPWSLAFGVSFATVDSGEGKGKHGSASAGTLDGFLAVGKFMASGEHFSEAGKTVTKSHELQVKGQPATLEIHTKSIRVFAGGFATSSSL